MAYEGSESAQDNFGKFIHQFQPETKTLIRKLRKDLKQNIQTNMSLLFNETCINKRLLPNYTRTRTHTHTHIGLVWFVWFYGISTFVGYLMPNPLYTYTLNIYDLVGSGVMAYQLS